MSALAINNLSSVAELNTIRGGSQGHGHGHGHPSVQYLGSWYKTGPWKYLGSYKTGGGKHHGHSYYYKIKKFKRIQYKFKKYRVWH